MRKLAKSEWTGVSVLTDRDKAAVKSWFGFLVKDMTPEKAEILCDIETDREKKIRAVMVDDKGKRFIATRTMGRKTYSVSLRPAA